MPRGRNIKGLEAALGYSFRSRATLDRALTHSSTRTDKVAGEDNERLEFLGDRVLGLAIAELLTEIDPKATEGALARRLNKMVKRETCAGAARSVGLGQALRISASEEDSGGRNKDTILADAIEALLAAIFLEAGYPTARDVVRRLWRPMLDDMPETVTDAKSALQEWAQGRGLPLPRYSQLSREGPDHAPLFTTEVTINGTAPATGRGASKRIAEQAAASALLVREGVWKRTDDKANG